MANRDRLTALDATFLHLERSGAHMHVAGVLVFEGGQAVAVGHRSILTRPRHAHNLVQVV